EYKLWCPESTWNQVEMGFQVGIKYSTPAPFPQVGIKQAYVPAVSSTHLAYKVPFHSPVLTAFGHVALDYLRTPVGPPFECDRPHMVVPFTVWGNPCSPSINNGGSYRNSHRFLTIPQVGIKHFPQVAIKLDSNLWELLDSKLIPDTREEKAGLRISLRNPLSLRQRGELSSPSLISQCSLVDHRREIAWEMERESHHRGLAADGFAAVSLCGDSSKYEPPSLHFTYSLTGSERRESVRNEETEAHILSSNS
ncbi:hypothetical protein PRIPAC_86057, partial [Pristionchus pacificus]|uniref:Uncharacterized protein n=1 Tax=Pristionchus pacificus TaxID=54126 RepID=A0A2A6BMA0_PRIPA